MIKIAGVIKAKKKLKRQGESKRQREEDFKVFDEIRKDNKDADPEEVQKDIEEAIKAVRNQNSS
jgi:hypothetical protein